MVFSCIALVLTILIVFAGMQILGFHRRSIPQETVMIDGQSFLIYDKQAPIQKIQNQKKHWKPRRIRVLNDFFSKHKIENILVAYGNIGALAIPLTTHVNKIITIEPDPKRYDLLIKNMELNKINNITTINVALDSSKYQGFVCRDATTQDDSGSTLILPEKQMNSVCCSTDMYDKKNQVSVVTLDSLKLEPVQAIVIEMGFNRREVSGFLGGSKDYIAKHKPIMIWDFESTQYDEGNIISTEQEEYHTSLIEKEDHALFAEYGYHLFHQEGPVFFFKAIK